MIRNRDGSIREITLEEALDYVRSYHKLKRILDKHERGEGGGDKDHIYIGGNKVKL